jgi:hypothetical protein
MPQPPWKTVFYTAVLATGLDLIGADPERRAPTLKAISKSYANLPAAEKHRVLVKMTDKLTSTDRTALQSSARCSAALGIRGTDQTSFPSR